MHNMQIIISLLAYGFANLFGLGISLDGDKIDIQVLPSKVLMSFCHLKRKDAAPLHNNGFNLGYKFDRNVNLDI